MFEISYHTDFSFSTSLFPAISCLELLNNNHPGHRPTHTYVFAALQYWFQSPNEFIF